jgi:ParB family chromosome partitioning protein
MRDVFVIEEVLMQLPDQTNVVDVASIHVGERHRKDLGDLDSLVASIREVGLLQPIVVTPDSQLIAGGRRLEAVRRLGWSKVAVRVIDLDNIVLGEQAENRYRKDLNPVEAVAIGRALEELEREKARKRQQEGGRAGGQGSGKLPEASAGDTRDKVAAAVGMSGRNFEKAKAVVQAAAERPELFGPIAEEMGRTGKVDKAYRKVKEQLNAKPKQPEGPKKTTVPGAAQELVLLLDAGKISRKEVDAVVRCLPKREQKKIAKRGAEAVLAFLHDQAWLSQVERVRCWSIWKNDEMLPDAQVTLAARRKGLDLAKEQRKGIDTERARLDAKEKRLDELVQLLETAFAEAGGPVEVAAWG